MSSSAAAAAPAAPGVLSGYAFSCCSAEDATAVNPVIASLGGIVLPLGSTAPFANLVSNDAGEWGRRACLLRRLARELAAPASARSHRPRPLFCPRAPPPRRRRGGALARHEPDGRAHGLAAPVLARAPRGAPDRRQHRAAADGPRATAPRAGAAAAAAAAACVGCAGAPWPARSSSRRRRAHPRAPPAPRPLICSAARWRRRRRRGGRGRRGGGGAAGGGGGGRGGGQERALQVL